MALAIAAGALAATPSFAQTSPMSGSVSLGVRSVDVDGAVTKYREDVNLDDGVRVFDLAFGFTAEPASDSAVDVLDVDASNLGGDPFETIHVTLRKYGVYDLKLDRRRSEYFYQDVILPADLADLAGSTGGDFHHFDFERIQDKAALDVHLSPGTELKLALERYTRTGDSTATLDIERDEFELERPIDESLNDLTVGVQHEGDKITLIFEQQLSEFENGGELFLPGASTGQNAEDPAELLFLRIDQSYDYDSAGQLVRIVAQPGSRFDVQAAWRREDLDLDMNASERAAGTGFGGSPFVRDATGTAAVERDIDVADLDVGYLLNERLRVIGGVRRLALSQDGNLSFGGAQGLGVWDIDTTGAEAGVELAVTETLALTGGLSTETRDASHATALAGPAAGDARETEHDGFFARLLYAAPGGLEITASIEDHDIDDPYTLAAPMTGRRYRVRGRYRWGNGLSMTASWRRNDLDNSLSGWSGETEQTDLSISYVGEGLQLSAGIMSIDLARSIDQTVAGGSRQEVFLIDYAADASFANASLRWQLNQRVAVGGQLRLYDNDGSFPVARDDSQGFVEVGVGERYAFRLEYRDIEYREDGFDDYDAQLLELGFGLRW